MHARGEKDRLVDAPLGRIARNAKERELAGIGIVDQRHELVAGRRGLRRGGPAVDQLVADARGLRIQAIAPLGEKPRQISPGPDSLLPSTIADEHAFHAVRRRLRIEQPELAELDTLRRLGQADRHFAAGDLVVAQGLFGVLDPMQAADFLERLAQISALAGHGEKQGGIPGGKPPCLGQECVNLAAPLRQTDNQQTGRGAPILAGDRLQVRRPVGVNGLEETQGTRLATVPFRDDRFGREELPERFGERKTRLAEFGIRPLFAVLQIDVASVPECIRPVEFPVDHDGQALQFFKTVIDPSGMERQGDQRLGRPKRTLRAERGKKSDGLQGQPVLVLEIVLGRQGLVRFKQSLAERIAAELRLEIREQVVVKIVEANPFGRIGVRSQGQQALRLVAGQVGKH